MKLNAMQVRVRCLEIIEQFGERDFDANDSLQEFFDSLELAELAQGIEEAFKIRLSEQFYELKTIGGLLTLVEQTVRNQHGTAFMPDKVRADDEVDWRRD